MLEEFRGIAGLSEDVVESDHLHRTWIIPHDDLGDRASEATLDDVFFDCHDAS